MKRWIAFALVAVLSIAATVALLAPAQWAAGALRSASGGRLDLAGATGSLWRGSAILVVSAGGGSGTARASLPEPVSWQLSPWALFTGTLDLTLDLLQRPLRPRRQHHMPAIPRKPKGNAPSDPARSAGNKGNTDRGSGIGRVRHAPL